MATALVIASAAVPTEASHALTVVADVLAGQPGLCCSQLRVLVLICVPVGHQLGFWHFHFVDNLVCIMHLSGLSACVLFEHQRSVLRGCN